jgi:hypothetical protein
LRNKELLCPRLRFCHVESSPFRAVDVKDCDHMSSDFGPQSSGSEERLFECV